jgi:hypothetical protein
MEIRKTLQRLLFLSSLAICYLACKKDGGDAAIADRPIVEAYLISGKAVSMKIYQQKGLLDTASYGAPISGLSISFSNGTKTISLKETTTGVYTSTETDLIIPGTTCSFNFTYNGSAVAGETNVPGLPVNFSASSLDQPVPSPDPDSSQTTFNAITFTWNNVDKGYYLMVFRNQEATPNRIGSGFGRRDNYRDLEEYLGQASTFKTQRMTFNFAGYYDTYLFHINEEYNNIINSSSTSSLNLTNPPSNIKNGLGIFTAMSCDSLLLHVYEQ